MFRFYDATRRRICLAAFCILCVLPTLAVAAWCVARNLPGRVRAEARALGRQLGLEVSLDDVRHPRPGETVYQGLKLADPETGQAVFRCRSLESVWTKVEDVSGSPRAALLLVASQPEVEAAAANRLRQLLARIMQAQNGQAEVEIRFHASELTLRAGETAQTLSEFSGGIGSLPGGIQAEATFRLAGSAATEPARILITRNRQVSPPPPSSCSTRAAAPCRAPCWPLACPSSSRWARRASSVVG
jgi:hypothetical protein